MLQKKSERIKIYLNETNVNWHEYKLFFFNVYLTLSAISENIYTISCGYLKFRKQNEIDVTYVDTNMYVGILCRYVTGIPDELYYCFN